jgi:hypothetical protein
MRKILGAAVAGLGATLMMEYVSSFLYERHSQHTREREERLRTEMPTTVLARKLARLTGTELDDQTAQRLGMVLHYSFGASGGPAAQLLVRRGKHPIRAALIVASAMEITVDQAANTVLGLTAPTWRFPLITQARAIAAHGAYGLALGLMLDAGRDD